MKLTNIKNPTYHRNGCTGEPFQLIHFDMTEDGQTTHMIAIRFQDDTPDKDGFSAPRIAVLDLKSLTQEIQLTWRGDQFAEQLDKHFFINNP